MEAYNLIYLETFSNVNKDNINENLDSTNPDFSYKKDFNLLDLNIEDNIISKIFMGPFNSVSENFDNNSSKSIYIIEKQRKSPNGNQSIFSSSKNNVSSFPDSTTSKNITFKTVLHHKRGRKEKYKKIGKKSHGSGDFDNIIRKIQVSFINFLINLANDSIKTILGEDSNYCFKDVKYKFKKIVSHDYVEKLKKYKYSDVIKMECSVKNKNYKQNSNLKTYKEVCKQSPEFKKLFDLNYLYIFKKYFCEIKNHQDIIDFDGLKIKLSPKTKGLFNLLGKNIDRKEIFNDAIKNVYFAGYGYKIDKKPLSSNPFFVSQKN